MKELSSRHVHIDHPFWTPRLEVNAHQAIFHQWEMLQASGCIDNFRIAAGELEGMRVGWFFADSDAYKWLEAAARILEHFPDERLVSLVADFIALLGRAQEPDGYLFTYNQIHFPGQRWINLQIEHELYCHGHLIEAGISHHLSSGQAEILEIARRAANLLVRDFLGAGPERTPGHEEIELALLRLYQHLGEPPYLTLAEQFIEQRGRTPFFALKLLRQNRSVSQRASLVRQQQESYRLAHPEKALPSLPPGNQARRPTTAELRWYLSALSGKYFQQHLPLRQQTIPVGHAVRFAYLARAAALRDRLRAENTYLPTLEQAWERLVSRRMYLSGGIGSLPGLEGFGRDYELDPEYAYAETCAALASLFWNWEMALLTGSPRYSDLFEWQLYNAASVGMGLNGTTYLYNNPLACRGGVNRRSWFAVACCPSNLSRTFADLEKYIFSYDLDAIWVHQYIGCLAKLPLSQPVGLTLQSDLPWSGKIHLRLDLARPLAFTLHLRLPSWAGQVKGEVFCSEQGEACPVDLTGVSPAPKTGNPTPFTSGLGSPVDNHSELVAQGYDPRESRFLTLARTWQPGDWIELEFEMPLVLRLAHPKVKGLRDKVALTRGPLLYCLESVDNPAIDLFSAALAPSSLRSIPANGQALGLDLAGEMTILEGKTKDGKKLTFIPYALWANRGEAHMTVWVNCPG